MKPKKKTKGYRFPLKKERLEFRNEYIEYKYEHRFILSKYLHFILLELVHRFHCFYHSADFPNRVGIRLEYLMGNTKVRLNDRQYMERLYQALTKEEQLNIKKTEYDRERIEMERVKKLVVEGEMTPPEELTYLYEHPVFR